MILRTKCSTHAVAGVGVEAGQVEPSRERAAHLLDMEPVAH